MIDQIVTYTTGIKTNRPSFDVKSSRGGVSVDHSDRIAGKSLVLVLFERHLMLEAVTVGDSVLPHIRPRRATLSPKSNRVRSARLAIGKLTRKVNIPCDIMFLDTSHVEGNPGICILRHLIQDGTLLQPSQEWQGRILALRHIMLDSRREHRDMRQRLTFMIRRVPRV